MFETPINVRWNDLDAFRHVNNAVFLTYFEIGRLEMFKALAWEWPLDPLIVARNEINYKSPLELEDNPILKLWCSKIGNKSFDIEYLLFKKDGILAADGRSVIVVFDYDSGQSKALSASSRTKLEQYYQAAT
jgi:acyl-CoA thioester hydrolase